MYAHTHIYIQAYSYTCMRTHTHTHTHTYTQAPASYIPSIFLNNSIILEIYCYNYTGSINRCLVHYKKFY